VVVLAAVVLLALPAATVVLTTLDPATAIARLADPPDPASAVITLVADARIGRLAWWACPSWGSAWPVIAMWPRAAPSPRSHRDIGVIVHLLTVAIALPAFDRYVTARPIGEALGRVAGEGVSVFTYGFDNREAVSPFMFYAGERSRTRRTSTTSSGASSAAGRAPSSRRRRTTGWAPCADAARRPARGRVARARARIGQRGRMPARIAPSTAQHVSGRGRSWTCSAPAAPRSPRSARHGRIDPSIAAVIRFGPLPERIRDAVSLWSSRRPVE
jgi:hypothetical protein